MLPSLAHSSRRGHQKSKPRSPHPKLCITAESRYLRADTARLRTGYICAQTRDTWKLSGLSAAPAAAGDALAFTALLGVATPLLSLRGGGANAVPPSPVPSPWPCSEPTGAGPGGPRPPSPQHTHAPGGPFPPPPPRPGGPRRERYRGTPTRGRDGGHLQLRTPR